MLSKKRIIIVTAVAVIAAMAAAVSFATLRRTSDSPPGFIPVQYASGTGLDLAAAGIQAGSLDNVLQQLQTRIADPSITSATVREVAPTASNAGGLTVFEAITSNGPGAFGIEATWKGEILAGAFRDAAASLGIGSVANFEIDEQVPDGQVTATDSGFGNVVAGQVFDTASDDAIAASIRSGLVSVGLKPLSVTFVHGLESAPVVIAETDDPSATVSASSDPKFWQEMLGNYLNYEGYYLELRDQAGNPVAISTAAHRAGSSSGWIRPDLQQRIRENPVPTGASGG